MLSAHSRSFDQVGSAPATLEPIGTYAAAAPLKSGIKALIPKNWTTVVHRDVALPSTINWAASDTWPQALAKFAEENGLAVMLDWNKSIAYIRTPQAAAEDAAAREQIRQTAATPLPSLAAQVEGVAQPAALVSAQPAVSSVTATVQADVYAQMQDLHAAIQGLQARLQEPQNAQQATIEQLREQIKEQEAQIISLQGSVNEARTVASGGGAKAFNRATLSEVAQYVAQAHGATLTLPFLQDVRFQGPVTVLGADLGEDVRLVLRALGPQAGVSAQVCRKPAQIAFVHGASPYEEGWCASPGMVVEAPAAQAAPALAALLAADGSFAAPSDPAQEGQSAATADAAPLSPVADAAAVAVAAPALLSLSVEPRQDAELAIREFLAQHGYTLKWDSAYEFKPEAVLTAEGADIVEIFEKVLPGMGLSAEVNPGDRSVRIDDARNEIN